MTIQTDRGPVVTFTIDDHDVEMTVEEVGRVSAAEFQRLYSVGLRLHHCHVQTPSHVTVV